MVTLYWALTGMARIESDSRSGHVACLFCPRVRRVFRGTIAALTAAVVMAVAPGAIAAEPPPKLAFDGGIELSATNGYHVFGLISSFEGKAQVSLFVGKAGETAIYTARGVGTESSVAVDFGPLGKVDLEVRPTGSSETIRPCGGKGKPTTIPASEFIGTLEFHGEDAFTEFSATNLPLRIEPLAHLVCGGVTVGTTSGSHVGGVQLKAKSANGPLLVIQQNHPGAQVFYEASMHEKEGTVQVSRSISGRLPAASIDYAPSLGSASFAAPSPFTGKATYIGRTPPGETRPGTGTWRGSLRVDFPGHADVPLAGSGFSATIVHAHRTESHQ